MKFLSLAIAAIVGMAEAKKTISAQQLKTRMRKGQFNKRTLMRAAKPYGETARKLEEAQEEQDWEINGLYSVQFKSCLSMTVADEDLFAEGFIDYASQGLLVAEKSFILFTACKSSDCYHQSDNEKMTFITDIVSFFQAFIDFLPNQVENYCEGCNQNYDYCTGALEQQQAGYGQVDDAVAEDAAEGEDQAAEEEQAAEGEQDQAEGEQAEGENQEAEGENAGRKLSKIANKSFRNLNNDNNKVIQMIDCDMCNAYECFDNAEEQAAADDGAVVYEFEDALGWLDALSQCQQIQDFTYDNMAAYSGLICNAEGTGVEIGVFVDQDCTLYAPKASFSGMMTAADSAYFALSEEIVEYMFTNDFSCYQPDVQYTNPYEYEEDEANQAAEEEQEDPGASEWCENLFDGDMAAVNLYECAAAEDQAEEEAEADQYLETYSWYSYDISKEQSEDSSEICQQVLGLNGKYSTLYDKSSSGTLYNYKKSTSDSNGMRPGGVATLVIFIVLASAGAAAYFVKTKKRGDKRAPLLNAEGSMA